MWTNKEGKRRNYEKGRIGCFRHSWTISEIKMVEEHSITDRELSKIIHHSVAAIQTKRMQLKKGCLNDTRKL